MRVHYIDVGQGDATLFEFPCGAVLVDTGGERNADFDAIEALKDYLDEFFMRRADLGGRLSSLVLSHPHIDHTRGVEAILNGYNPRNIVTNGQEEGSGRYQQRRAHRHVAARELTADTSDDVGFQAITMEDIGADGLTGPVIDPVACSGTDPQLRVLWGRVNADPGWGSHHGKRNFDNKNNHSIVLRVDYGGSSVLLTGDLEEVAINDMVKRYEATSLLDVDVYQAGHHGSVNGTTTGLVKAMSPEIAVFSMGPHDREASWTAWAYGHPRKEVVAMLANAVSSNRPAIDVMVGKGSKQFESLVLSKGIYATGWDGTVVLSGKADGTWSVAAPTTASALININTASVAELVTLPGIGLVKAQRIVAYREASGNFTSVDDLVNVSGIGPATLEAVRHLITL